MGLQIKGWNSDKVFAKRVARYDGPVILVEMTETDFERFGMDMMVKIEDTPDIKMAFHNAINQLKRELADTKVEFALTS